MKSGQSPRLEFDEENEAESALVRGNSRRRRPTKLSFLLRCCLVEFTGDFIFIALGSLQATSGVAGVIVPALAHGIAIFVLIAAMGHISGGHYNPAVTFGVFISGNLGIISTVCYVLSQLLGGSFGALFVRAIVPNATYVEIVKGGVTVPAPGIHPAQAIGCELLLTYVLVMTVLLTAVDTNSNVLAALAIGLSITIGIFAGGNISGGSVNPARSFGPAVIYSFFGPDLSHWNMHYVYWAGPLSGAGIAALCYRAFLAKDEKRWLP